MVQHAGRRKQLCSTARAMQQRFLRLTGKLRQLRMQLDAVLHNISDGLKCLCHAMKLPNGCMPTCFWSKARICRWQGINAGTASVKPRPCNS